MGEKIANLENGIKPSFPDIHSSALLTTIVANSPIRHDGVAKDSTLKNVFANSFSSPQIGTSQVSTIEVGSIKHGTAQVGY